ncbi:MAG: class I SAM-dependent methyltransferase [Verrucomicrobiota bacterium]
MQDSFEYLKRTWQTLGRDDPLWAVVSLADKRGGKWDVREFLQTGDQDVARYRQILKLWARCPDRFRHVLDFGCGVGRLCLAWSKSAGLVTGVDVSASMIECGKRLLSETRNVELILNEQDNLKCFATGQFDLVCSLACLQHMPWDIAANYVREFARVCSTDGWVAFQVPARQSNSGLLPALRKKLVDSLPFGLGRLYRNWRHGTAAVFEMYFTPVSVVLETASAVGLRLIHREPDQSAGEASEGYFYIFQKASPR